MDTNNYRGYAFTALLKAYTRQLQWNQYAAANRHGYYPMQYEWIAEGMRAFDVIWLDADHNMDMAREIILDIIIKMQKAITADMKGHFQYYEDEDGTQVVTPKYDTILDAVAVKRADGVESEVTVGDMIPDYEEGYGSVEDRALMRQRIAILTERLRPDDLKILLSYVDGTYDSLTAACGGGDENATKTAMLSRRIRKAMDGQQFLPVFA